MTQNEKQQRLKTLPGVDHILEKAGRDNRFDDVPRNVLRDAVRTALDRLRKHILNGDEDPRATIDTGNDAVLDQTHSLCREKLKPRLIPLVNATGVVLHTNLGRALLCRDALDNIRTISSRYSNLEFTLSAGKRGLRYTAVEDLICELTGAESAIAVNNNAGAVLLALNTLAKDTEVIVSRGELVEIGGSFRVPDVMAKSGCRLIEVGTTNRTHLRDYVNAVTEDTGLFLKVHTSNYRIQGFTKSVGLAELAELGAEKSIPVMEDLGSGTLIDFSKYGLPFEPTVSDTVASGADVVTFSGDKLLGGPQAGIITGKKAALDRIKANPLTRALRIDKMTLAALEATLKLYRDEEKAIREIPTLRMLTMGYDETCEKAKNLADRITKACGGKLLALELADLESRPGGGSYPVLKLPTRCLSIKPAAMSVAALERRMRLSDTPVIARIENDRYVMDPRTIQPGQEEIIISTLETILG